MITQNKTNISLIAIYLEVLSLFLAKLKYLKVFCGYFCCKFILT